MIGGYAIKDASFIVLSIISWKRKGFFFGWIKRKGFKYSLDAYNNLLISNIQCKDCFLTGFNVNIN